MNAQTTGILIHLPAKAENVALVRHALAGAAEHLGMTEEVIGDLKTVVTEACMNVVLHAYDGESGPLEVRAWQDGPEFVITVRDFGNGIRPRADGGRSSLRLGLSLIAAMSSSFEISGGTGRGTTITMRLSLIAVEPVVGPVPVESIDENNRVVLTAWDAETLAPILARVVSVLAARRDMSIDALSDAVLLSDALSADLVWRDGSETVRVTLTETEVGIHLEVGPLAEGLAGSLKQGLYLPEELGGSLESLADAVEVEDDEQGEYLRVRFLAVNHSAGRG